MLPTRVHNQSRSWRRAAFIFIIAALALQTIACAASFGGSNDNSEATIAALQATINAPTATPVPTNTAEPTVVPPTQAPPPTVAPQTTPVPQPAQPEASPQAPQPPANIEELIPQMNVLLYEDVAGYPNVFRYVAAAMERLGFQRGQNYVDVGDAGGRLLDQMLGGNAPNGKPWDLIIISDEVYTDIQGDFFEAMERILAQGKTSIILEHYFLDEIGQGTAKPVLLRCGVNVREWPAGNSNDLDLVILDPNHPAVNELVKITGFRVADTWSHGSDIGDLMYLSGTGDAKMILGTRPLPGDDRQYGALVECANGNMMLQTTGSHNYMDESMVSLWANNIHYMLRKRLEARSQ